MRFFVSSQARVTVEWKFVAPYSIPGLLFNGAVDSPGEKN